MRVRGREVARKALGIAMLAAPFVALYGFIVAVSGWRVMLIALGAPLVLWLWISVAVALLSGRR